MLTLITGGAGFIGSHLVERLLDQGQRVHVLDNFNDFYDPAIKRANLAAAAGRDGFSLFEGDIRDGDFGERLFSEHGYDRVVHLAARAGVRPSVEDPPLYQSVNIHGTTTLLELARRHGVSRFLFASSSSVYGNNEKVPFSESDRVDRPISPYAATKLAGELLCHSYHHLYQIPIVCLRFFTVYGPRQRPEMAIHKFTRMIVDGDEIPIFGDGSTARDYTYIDDIVDGIQAALDIDVGYDVLNLGSSGPIALSDLVSLIERTLGREARVRHFPTQPGDVERTFADVTRAERILGFQPRIGIEEGISRFVDWYARR